MRNLTTEQQVALSARHGQEFYYVVQVNWPDGMVIYSRKAEDGCQPFLLEVNDYYSTGRIDGFGSAGQISVTLADPHGILKYRFDNYNLLDVPCHVAIRSTSEKHNCFLPIFSGLLSAPMEWAEGQRTFVFNIVSNPSNQNLCYTPDIKDIDVSETFGYVPILETGRVDYFNIGWRNYVDMIGSAYISSEKFRTDSVINKETWPLSFNYVQNVAVQPIAKSPEAKVTRAIPDTTGGWAARREAIEHNKAAAKANSIALADVLADYSAEIAALQATADSLAEVSEAALQAVIAAQAVVDGLGDDPGASGAAAQAALEDAVLQAAIAEEAAQAAQAAADAAEAAGPTIDPDRDRAQYVAVPAASGKIIIPIANSEGFTPFVDTVVEIKDSDDLILAVGQFIPEVSSDDFDYDPNALTGYFIIHTSSSAIAWPLAQIPNPNYDPQLPEGEGNPATIPDTDNLPPLSNALEPLPDFINFNLPLYKNLKVYQRKEVDGYDPNPIKDNAVTQEEKRLNLIESYQIKSKTRYVDQIREYGETKEEFEEDDVKSLEDLVVGFGQDGLTQFHILGYYDGSTFVPVDFRDFPWLGNSTIEVEVDLEAAKPSLDPDLDVSGFDDIGGFPTNQVSAFATMNVTEQLGYTCYVENPLNWRFLRVRSVFKNNKWVRKQEQLVSLQAKPFATQTAQYRQMEISSGASIRLFNWQPEKQYVVDCKPGTTVKAVKYISNNGKVLENLSSFAYQVENMGEGTIWAGYHPACTMIYLSFNALMRLKDGRDMTELYVDLDSPYRTDEEIMAKATDMLAEAQRVPFTRQINFYPNGSVPRECTVILEQEIGIREFLTHLAFQNGKIIRGEGNVVRSRSLMRPGPSEFTIKSHMIIERSLVMGLTQELQTVFDITYNSTDRSNQPYKTTRKSNCDVYGEKKIQWEFDCYPTFLAAEDVLAFWANYFSNYWRTLKIKTTLECAHLQVYDTVGLDFTDINLNFSEHYEEVTGLQLTLPNVHPSFSNTLGVVTSMKYNIEDGTILMELWLPIYAGDTQMQPVYWDTI